MYSSRFLMLFTGLEQDGFHISIFPILASEADLFIDTDVLVSSPNEVWQSAGDFVVTTLCEDLTLVRK
jgi:hypothetical protein